MGVGWFDDLADMEEADLLYLGLSTDAHGSSSVSILVPFFSRATSLVTRHDWRWLVLASGAVRVCTYTLSIYERQHASRYPGIQSWACTSGFRDLSNSGLVDLLCFSWDSWKPTWDYCASSGMVSFRQQACYSFS
jgi:hypothetical protein